MALNAAALLPEGASPQLVPGEKPFLAQKGVALELKAHGTGPVANTGSYFFETGTLFLTSLRVIYLPTKPLEYTRSFSAPIANVVGGDLHQPLFSPNYFECRVVTVPNSGLPQQTSDLKLTFRDGGAYDFQTTLSGIRSRMPQPDVPEALPLYAPRESATPDPVVPDASNAPSELRNESVPPPSYDEGG
ncbi:hypothetical protein DFJ74DRAFT_604334 [Hyaloraphidium curvatum]|nr:hypothetical protein DFJ74DRAFT_604334 [Hyaloraphidium curvatum]